MSRFVFCVHNHQPVGNFGFVIEDAYRSAYEPFLAVLERHPAIRFAMHTSGPLWDWLAAERPDYLRRVRALVERGQLELLTGAYYEPILPVVPRADALGQIRKLTAFLGARFGAAPTGAWLAERVWEPSLPALLSEAGVRYVPIDDAHFRRAGLIGEDLGPYYLTEDQGRSVAVFPISKELRYRIPYDTPEGAADYLAAAPWNATQVFADDGEKFGVWPGTHRCVYEEGWLERFLVLLEERQDRVQTATFADVLADTPAAGLVYLPTASYSEMMEWALPVPVQEKLADLHARLAQPGGGADDVDLLGGGFWRMFLARYPEANRLHKRVHAIRARWERLEARASGTAGREAEKRHAAALEELWQAECNCGYWHGVFGGLYLPHLRGAAWTHAIRADTLLAGLEEVPGTPRAALADVDLDGRIDAVLEVGAAAAFVDDRGAALGYEVRALAANMADVVARRREVYHAKVKDALPRDAAVRTIHGTYTTKEPGLERLLVYDRGARGIFVDRLPETGEDVAAAAERAAARPVEATQVAPAVVGADGEAATARVAFELAAPDGTGVRVRKTVRLLAADGALEARYVLEPLGERPLPARFASEISLSLFRGTSPSRLSAPGGRVRDAGDAAERISGGRSDGIEIGDTVRGARVRVTFTETDGLALYPIETVSLSEDGFERVLQGVAIVPVWELGGRARELTVRLDVAPRERQAAAGAAETAASGAAARDR